jgi:transposase
LAKGKLKKKVDLLVKALEGNVTDHHRFLLKQHLAHVDFLAKQIETFDDAIRKKLSPYETQFNDIQSVTGVKDISAASVIAEIGVNMSKFPDEAHLSSWAAICPGNNESAGKKKSGKTRRGNNYLKATLTESAWAASRTKGAALNAVYHIIARRRGKKRALVAVGHRILIEIYRVLKTGKPYQDVGEDIVNERRSKNREQAMIRDLERRGYAVSKVMTTI